MKATLNGVKIRFEDAGSGPTILVLHDGSTNWEIEKLFAPLTMAGYRMVVTHLDGFRRKGKKGIDLPASAEQAIALLNFLGIGRAVIFGIGLGGMVLLELLDRCPERVVASSLVLGNATAKEIRQLISRPEVNAALKEGRLHDIKADLLAILPAAEKEKTAQSPLPQLRSWVNRVGSRNHYLSAVTHRSSLIVEMEVPPLIIECDESDADCKQPPCPASLASRGWRRIVGVNAHLAALFNLIVPDDAEEEEILSNR